MQLTLEEKNTDPKLKKVYFLTFEVVAPDPTTNDDKKNDTSSSNAAPVLNFNVT